MRSEEKYLYKQMDGLFHVIIIKDWQCLYGITRYRDTAAEDKGPIINAERPFEKKIENHNGKTLRRQPVTRCTKNLH